ncbi:DinB family protein [Aggregatilinea lenta]|uniref:DinB family protein n=1 Tax=Aggregatilinea lenta TaxID=913108 RepID=UPI0013C2B025|nr:DinB family protein [Aggregatilinea lenta]
MPTKTELLDAIREGRVKLAALWVGLTDDEMLRPGLNGDWAVKDLIAHLVFWERRMVEHAPRVVDGERLPSYELDALNAQVYAANRDRALDDLRADFRALLPQIEAMVKGLPDDALDRQLDALDGAALWEFIAGDSSGHYAEHLDALQAWSAQLKAERALTSPGRSSLKLVRRNAVRRKRARENRVTGRIGSRLAR